MFQQAIRQTAGIFLGPMLLLVGAAWLAARSPELGERDVILLSALPWLVHSAAIGVAARFSKTRTVYAGILVGLSWYFVTTSAPAVPEAQRPEVLGFVALLFAANIGLLGIVPDRGLATPLGLIRAIVVGSQVVLVASLLRPTSALGLDWLSTQWWPAESLDTWLPQPVIAAFALSIVVLTARTLWRPATGDVGLIAALVCGGAAFHLAVTPALSAIYFLAAGVALLFGTIEASYSHAYRDDLTGLPARRALNEEMQRLGSRYTIAMLDVDHFKSFNDKHGHDVGDQVLKMVAAKIGRVRGGGRAFRYGGEEFTIVFPRKSPADAAPFLEEVRAEIEDARLTLRSATRAKKKPKKGARKSKSKASAKTVSVTISIGAAARGKKAARPDAVLKRADEMLYKAKRSGRNQVTLDAAK